MFVSTQQTRYKQMSNTTNPSTDNSITDFVIRVKRIMDSLKPDEKSSVVKSVANEAVVSESYIYQLLNATNNRRLKSAEKKDYYFRLIDQKAFFIVSRELKRLEEIRDSC